MCCNIEILGGIDYSAYTLIYLLILHTLKQGTELSRIYLSLLNEDDVLEGMGKFSELSRIKKIRKNIMYTVNAKEVLIVLCYKNHINMLKFQFF